MSLKQIFKIIVMLGLGVYGIYGAFHVRSLWLVDGANLLFHEAGHIFFQALGEFIGIMGGTLTQLLIPAGIAIAFYFKRQFYSASVMVFWFGENLFGIATYIQDARSRALPLVGGEIHDWGYILGKCGLLEYDLKIGLVVWLTGILIVIASTAAGIYFSGRDD